MTKNKIIYIVLLGLLLVSVLVSILVGAFPISLAQIGGIVLHSLGVDTDMSVASGQYNVLVFIRLPRVLLAVLVGAVLSVSGVAMQGLFRNPLADPGLIGISSGAVLASALAIVSGVSMQAGFWGMYGLSAAAFAGALACSFLVLKIASGNKQTDVSALLLSGIAVNALCGALTAFIIFFAKDDELRSITFWSMGSLGGATWTILLTTAPLLLFPLVLLPRMAKQLDAFSLGETEANCLGLNVQKFKTSIVIGVTFAVGVSVALVGTIGFIGLVVPHIARLLFGSSHRHVFWGSTLLGAVILIVSDTICRTVVMPAELPIGIITAIMGAPLFISLLIRQKNSKANYV